MLKVFGHISPDTDATGSAILWAWYLNTHTSHEAEPYVLGALNKETQFVLSHWKIAEPALLESINPGDEVSIVDTNNPQELLPNIADASIVHIVDHHILIGGLTSKVPIEMHLIPLASTASVIHTLLGKNVETMPKEMKGLMLSCILSDTLEFRSPTTTPHDREIASKLAADLGIDMKSYADQMFKAKSDVSDFTDKGLIHLDSKKFAIGSKNVRVSVIETTDPASILSRKVGITETIASIIKEEGDIDDVLFFIVDILKEEATVFTYNDFTKGIISESFGVKADTDTVTLPGIVSRKKQIVPSLKLPV